MRQLVYIKPGVTDWQEAADPQITSADDAIVRPIAVAACDLDTALLRGLAPFPGPFPLGHEFVAEIVAAGEAASGFAKGQRVIVPFQIACGDCARCRRGLTGSCSAVPTGSMYGLRPRRAAPLGGDFGGALADLVRVPFAPHMLVPVPPGVEPAAVASLSDNVSDAWRTVAPPLRECPGADVLIVGSASSIPLYAILVARACGAGRVDFVANDAHACERAAALGANVIGDRIPKRAGAYPITVDASHDAAGLACALRSLEPEGVCTSASIYFAEVALPMLELYTRGVRFVTGRVNSRAVLPQVLALVADGRLHPEAVTSELVAWDEAPRALASPSLKPVFVR